ncbi:MAG: 2Fe-2S iron-sulfur cluster binding domain-containing protein [Treponema sp.]|jgi:carbon-monoxide dehydrogenase small subunit|nr:2Fe-2S iron-sulfur cluster binding domain-containing protein [Treponema sp.]
MKIPVRINGEQIQIDCPPDANLLTVLRRRGYTGVKCGCQKGLCGACTVLLNDLPVLACLVPLAAVRNAAITTLGHFAQTDFYADIRKGFAGAEAHLCGICDAGKIFAAYQLLSNQISGQNIPDRDKVSETMSQLGCYCSDLDSLVDGVLAAAAFRRERKNAEETNGRR